MKIAIIGSGIVGKGAGAGFQQLGHDVIYYDVNPSKLTELRNCLTTQRLEDAITFADMSFVCVPTPYNNGIDLSYLKDAVQSISEILKEKNEWHLVVIKSTVIPLTCDNVVKPILDSMKKPYGLCMNPEFLTEISTSWTNDTKFKRDFWCKERIVIGEKDKKSGDMLASIYQPLNAPIFRVDLKTAEMTKYATNMMLATKISYWNEIFLICKELKIDSKQVADITALDERIGRYGTVHGLAYSGTCLVAGTKINMGDRLVNIEDVEVGDEVFDGENFTKVTAISNRVVDQIIRINARGREIAGSADHIQIILDKLGNESEIRLSDVKVGHNIIIPKQQIEGVEKVVLGDKPNGYIKWWFNEFIIDKDFAWLMGLYIAEGVMAHHKRKREIRCEKARKRNCDSAEHRVIWCLGEHERWLADEIVRILKEHGIVASYKLKISNGTYGISRCWAVRGGGQGLITLFKKLNMSGTARTKNIVFLKKELAEAFIGGWLDGDGSLYKGTLSGYSRSRELIHSIDTMLLSLGINANIGDHGQEIQISERADVKRVASWSKRHKYNDDTYVRNHAYKSPTKKMAFNGWSVEIYKVERIDGQRVYAIETESGRYVANNILTHNCLPKDIKAFTHAFCTEEIDGTKEYLRYPSVLNETDAINDFMEENYGKRE